MKHSKLWGLALPVKSIRSWKTPPVPLPVPSVLPDVPADAGADPISAPEAPLAQAVERLV